MAGVSKMQLSSLEQRSVPSKLRTSDDITDLQRLRDSDGDPIQRSPIRKTETITGRCCGQWEKLSQYASITYRNSRRILHFFSAADDPKIVSDRKVLWRLFIARMALLVITVLVGLGVSYVVRWYSTALSTKQESEFWQYLGIFMVICLVASPIFAVDGYVDEILAMRFRQCLADIVLSIYMSDRAYYHIKAIHHVDNPGQRLGEDIRSFSYGIFGLMEKILRQILNLLGFSFILFSIDMSTVPLLVIYSCFGTLFVLTFFSEKLTSLSFLLMRDSAEFRANIIRINDSAEQIAIYGAEKHESKWLQQRLDTLISDGIRQARWSSYLGLFNHVFRYLSMILPYVVLARQYFANKIEFGELSQSAYAFSALLAALNIITSNLSTITSLSSTSQRVVEAIDAIEMVKADNPWRNVHHNPPNDENNTQTETNEGESGLVVNEMVVTKEHSQSSLIISDLSYFAPKSDVRLVKSLNCIVNNDESLLIMGASGCGKSSLMRVVAGLWVDGSGSITRPPLNDIMFLPQKPYLPNLPLESNTLRNQILFPKYFDDGTGADRTSESGAPSPKELIDRDSYKIASHIDDRAIINALHQINLSHLQSYSSEEHSLVNCTADWANSLSVGEQQRLAVGRVLLSRPKMIFLDESTSALDARNEALIYETLAKTKIPMISIGHHDQLANYHSHVLYMYGGGHWKLWTSSDYLHSSRTLSIAPPVPQQ